METSVHDIAASVGSRDLVELDITSASLNHAAPGRNWNGPIYVATPSLLRAFGIKSSAIDPTADVLTVRPGLSTLSDMQLVYGGGGKGGTLVGPGTGPNPVGQSPGQADFSCPRGSCIANPVIQEESALPSGTSAPNTVITEHAVHQLGLPTTPAGWLIQSAHPLTAAQISGARLTAAAAGLAVETKSSAPTSSEIINWATVFGIVLALGVLAMSVGLIRSETAGDLRTLAATGASSSTRRSLTAATAGALALLGAVLGTVAGYVAAIGWFRSKPENGGLSALSSAPTVNLLIILIGMPLIAAVGGWLLAGREPPAIAHQPME
jgi:putative ABC transport system permease protein